MMNNGLDQPPPTVCCPLRARVALCLTVAAILLAWVAPVQAQDAAPPPVVDEAAPPAEPEVAPDGTTEDPDAAQPDAEAAQPDALAPPPVEAANSTVSSKDQDGDDLLWRRIIAGTSIALVYSSVALWAYFAWYRKQTISDDFLVADEGWFGPNTYAGGSDKLGHMTSNYIMARGISQVLQFGGFEPLPASLSAATLTLAFFTGLELKDAYHAGFGFSFGDMVANTVGNGLAILTEMVPSVDKRFSLRFEYTPSAEYVELVRKTGTVDAAEDYSGQRFLLAYHLGSIDSLKAAEWWGWTRFVDVTMGYYSRNFLPAPDDPTAYKARRLFLGFSLNVQQLVDEFIFDNERRGVAYGISHFATEVLAVPFTTVDVVGVESLTDPLLDPLKD